jgi:hypothetical protein
MKNLLFLILFPTILLAQNDSIVVQKPNLSLISLNKLNIVYKGIPNSLSVLVKDSKSYKLKGEGITQHEDGSYSIRPKSGKEAKVMVEIQTTDSTKVFEEHSLRVKELPMAAILVNQKGCINCECTIEMTAADLLNAQVSVKLIDFLLDYNITVTGFRLYLTNTNGETLDSFDIQGSRIPDDVYDTIINNKKANLIIIHKITFTSDLGLSIAKTPLVRIKKI